MIYRKLKPDDMIDDGDMYASPCVNVSGKHVKQIVFGCSEILRPIPDEPEDVVRVEGEIQRVVWGDENIVVVHCAPRSIPSSVTINQRVTLLIPRPDPPVPKCPYCGMELTIRHNGSGCWAECLNPTCTVVVRGKTCSTRREAIEAMRPKGGGQ